MVFARSGCVVVMVCFLGSAGLAQDGASRPPSGSAAGEVSSATLGLRSSGDTGWYMRGGVQPFGGGLHEPFDEEYGFTLAGGYDFGPITDNPPEAFNLGVRADLELSWMREDVDGVGGSPGDGDVDTTSLFANGFLDYDIPGRFSFFTGLGLGRSHAESDLNGFTDDDDTSLAAQVMLGAEFELTERVLLYAMQRFRWYGDLDLAGVDADDYNESALEIGARYTF